MRPGKHLGSGSARVSEIGGCHCGGILLFSSSLSVAQGLPTKD